MIVCCSFELDNIIQIHHRFSPYLNQVDRDRTTQNPIFFHCDALYHARKSRTEIVRKLEKISDVRED